jgi:DNA-binding GntR family transcriptional regulator
LTVTARKGGGRAGRRISGPSLVELAADSVRHGILVGDLPAGERILLDELAEELGISPIPVREALRIVATEGLVVPVARRGYTVAPIHVDDLRETYRLRAELEPLAVKLAVPQLTAEALETLEAELELLAAAYEHNDARAHLVHHRAFHFGMYDHCNSPWLLRFTEMLWTNSERYQYMTTRIEGALHQRLNEHRRIFAAVRARDGEGAAALMHTHLNQAEKPVAAFLARVEAQQAAAADGAAAEAAT